MAKPIERQDKRASVSPVHIFDPQAFAQFTREEEKQKNAPARASTASATSLSIDTSRISTSSPVHMTGPAGTGTGDDDGNTEMGLASTFMSVELKEYREFNIDHEEGVYAIKWSPDGTLLAIGCSDGDIRVLTRTGRLLYKLRTVGNMPCTCLRWQNGDGAKENAILVATLASGKIQYWHVPSQKNTHTIDEKGNQIFCIDFRNDGRLFATGGMDRKIRLYDDSTKKMICAMERGYVANKPGHSNRIFAVKFKEDDPNVLLSGSWDDTVLFWDVRSKGSFRSIYGPHIAGQALDIVDDVIVTGSWRSSDAIQSFDFKSGRLITTVEWTPSPMIYSAQFVPGKPGIVAAGGTGSNCVKLVDLKTGAKSKSVHLPDKKGVYSLDYDENANVLAIAGRTDVVSLFTLKNVKDE